MDYTSIIIAFLGGLSINLLNLIELQNTPKTMRPDFKDWLYWLPYIVWPLLGALLAYVYEASGTPLKPLIALQVGATAPLIIKAMAKAVPKPTIDPGPGA